MASFNRVDGESESFENAAPVRSMPHSVEAEASLLSCVLMDGADVLAQCNTAGITRTSFYESKHSVIFATCASLWSAGKPVDVAVVAEELKSAGQLDAIGGYPYLTHVSSRIPTTAQTGYFIEKVRNHSLLRDTIHAANATAEAARMPQAVAEEITGQWSRHLDGIASSPIGSIIESLAQRRAGFGRIIKKQEPVISLVGTPIFTRGNIGTITAQKKEGKSAAVGAIIGALIGGPDCSGDTLRFTANNEASHAVIHLDTEQAPEDHEKLAQTALARSGHGAMPPWLYSYGVKGVSLPDLHRLLHRLLKEAAKLHGGVCALILDGVADFVSDPNKPEECNPFVTTLEGLATDFNCAVVCVLHLNPVREGGTAKSRGHLGSQLERKCETDLRLVKDKDGVTTMFTACARRAPIFEKDGARFKWRNEDNMHVSLEQSNGAASDQAAAEAAREMAADVFSDRASMRYGELIAALQSAFKCSQSQAERKYREMKEHAAIKRFPPNLWAKAS